MTRKKLMPIRERMLAMIMQEPFVQGIRTGDLSQASRDYYVAQDHHYVDVFMRLLEQTNAQLPSQLRRNAMSESNESDAHLGLATSERYKQIVVGVHNTDYLDHLRDTVAKGDPLASMLALLPCTESYGLIAQRLQQQGVASTGFGVWVDYYADQAYQSIIDWSWRTVDQLFAQKQSATADYAIVYETSYQHELAFWQAANQ
jgi:thiaminase/transcriptional activator TenA